MHSAFTSYFLFCFFHSYSSAAVSACTHTHSHHSCLWGFYYFVYFFAHWQSEVLKKTSFLTVPACLPALQKITKSQSPKRAQLASVPPNRIEDDDTLILLHRGRIKGDRQKLREKKRGGTAQKLAREALPQRRRRSRRSCNISIGGTSSSESGADLAPKNCADRSSADELSCSCNCTVLLF